MPSASVVPMSQPLNANASDTTVSVTPKDSRIAQVLVLDADAKAGLAALMGNLESIFEAPGVTLAPNQREYILSLRLAAYGY